ncbi:hypothetical protein MUN84_19325 [Hymenobacter sp. 5516J-16]|uniref:Secreted protein n=1 Tax=Hymenobacter sublimis TaxID=2933777 RepID=A0ABY4JEY2_9BACT|nr:MULTISPECIES: hypothetical protein [Hymenobacter]UOQ76652.1 hypothetical protein MUN84_19325 [Hymenobacter sp. 5516J-16]UPL50321.1 hypothetical protein MWH26_05280 [Hymenobacter sublimis]
MTNATCFFCTTTLLASAEVAGMRTKVAPGKRVALPVSAGLLMVKKSKKRNPT